LPGPDKPQPISQTAWIHPVFQSLDERTCEP
jgi:hypothetical protein